MELTVYLGAEFLHLEITPTDKRRPELKQYQNDEEGLKNLRIDLNRTLTEEMRRIHVFHSEVHLV